MDCPHCGLINPDSAERCDCGYDFRSGEVGESLVPEPVPSVVRGWLWLCIILFALGALFNFVLAVKRGMYPL